MKYYNYETKFGLISIGEENNKIVKLSFKEIEDGKLEETPLIKETYKQVTEYIDGKRKIFDIPIFLEGTQFQLEVWEALKRIPYGMAKTYGEIAKEIGREKAVRAVGGACHVNPIAIIVPCHRVIGQNGKLVGFAGGLNWKQNLLNLEK